MPDELKKDSKRSSLQSNLDNKVQRKLKAQQNPSPGVWFGLGKMGIVGWSVVIPTLLGAALGFWIDKHHPGTHSWTLMLLLIGLIIGCLSAWHWISQENKDMHDEKGEKK